MERFLKSLSFLTSWKFVNCIISTAPICIWLAIISFKRNWRTFLSNPAVRLFCIFAIVDLCVKLHKIITSGYFERRYMLPFLCVLIIFAADGLLSKLAPFLHNYLHNRFPFFTLRKITVSLISIIFIIYFVVIMIPSLDHPWFQGIRTLVKEECPKGKKSIILSNYSDTRLGYYSDSELFIFSINNFKLTNKAYTYRKPWSSDEFIKTLPSSINSFVDNVKRLGGDNVFIFFYGKRDSEFRKLFEEKNLSFPFKLLNVYHTRHNRPINFYQFEGNLKCQGLRAKD